MVTPGQMRRKCRAGEEVLQVWSGDALGAEPMPDVFGVVL
jgi:hypothetical protein